MDHHDVQRSDRKHVRSLLTVPIHEFWPSEFVILDIPIEVGSLEQEREKQTT